MMPFRPHSHLMKTAQILISLAFYVTLTSSTQCKQVDSCRCQFSNGSTIDLRRLAKNGEPRWANLKAVRKDDYEYFYNPCFDFKLPNESENITSGCSDGVAVCQVSSNKQNYYSLGSQEHASFHWNETDNKLHLMYNTPERITNITLICSTDSAAHDRILVQGELRPLVYEMTLTSVCACPDGCVHKEEGLSGGSVLIILFSVFVILYLIFGMVYNKLTRGAQGWELIPNYEFWQDFPLLVRDGCVYVASGCKPDTTYERI